MIRKGYLLFAMILLVVPGISQGALIYTGSLTDVYSGTYDLTINGTGNNFSAVLSVDTNVVSNAYIDWFTVHFDTPAAVITTTGISTSPTTGTWTVGSGQNVSGYGGTFPNGTAFTGGFEDGLISNPLVLTNGFALDGGTYQWSFNFTAEAPILGQDGNGNPNLQVGFYGSGVDGTPRLSQDFQVPEAGALLLFGSGLIGLVGYRRVRRMQ